MCCNRCRAPNTSVEDLRPALAAAYRDMADQARQSGALFVADIWERAADLALGFVTKPGPSPLPKSNPSFQVEW